MKIEINHITQIYKNKTKALDDITLDITPGLVGLLVRNGAGKTSLMRILATVMQPSSGDVCFDGKSVAQNLPEFRAGLGYLPQNTKLMPYMNVFEFMDYMCVLKGINDKTKRNAEALRCITLVGLQDQGKKALGKFSGGMLRRAGIAQALIGDPKFLIIDEPTTGLDPEEQLYFLNLLARVGGERTVLFSTHIIQDVENICERVCIIDYGKLLYHGTIENLLLTVNERLWQCTVAPGEEQALRDKAIVTRVAYTKGKPVIRYVAEKSVFDGSERVVPALEDAFLYTLGGVKR